MKITSTLAFASVFAAGLAAGNSGNSFLHNCPSLEAEYQIHPGLSRQEYLRITSLEKEAREAYLSGKRISSQFPNPHALELQFREAAGGVEPYIAYGETECALRAVGGLPQLGSLDYRIEGVIEEARQDAAASMRSTAWKMEEAGKHAALKTLKAWKELNKLLDGI